jgi:hypothetical protein
VLTSASSLQNFFPFSYISTKINTLYIISEGVKGNGKNNEKE